MRNIERIIGSADMGTLLFLDRGHTMVLKEWGEIRQLYANCMPPPYKSLFATRSTWIYWCAWVNLNLLMLALLMILIDIVSTAIPPSVGTLSASIDLFGFVTIKLWTFGWMLAIPSMLASHLLIEKALAREFRGLYNIHGIKQYFWWRRRFYLHYALFLRALTDRTPPATLTCKMITQLRSFADIAGPPPQPESRLLQPAYIVPFLVLLNALIAEVLKQAELLKGPIGVHTLTLYVIFIWVTYNVFSFGHIITTSGRAIDRNIQRFLEWAQRDMAEEQFLRAAAGTHESA